MFYYELKMVKRGSWNIVRIGNCAATIAHFRTKRAAELALEMVQDAEGGFLWKGERLKYDVSASCAGNAEQ